MSEETEGQPSNAITALGFRVGEISDEVKALNNTLGELRNEMLFQINSKTEEIALRIVDIEVLELEDLQKELEESKERYLDDDTQKKNETPAIVHEVVEQLKAIIEPELLDIREDIQRQTQNAIDHLAQRIKSLEEVETETVNQTVKETLREHLDAGKVINLGKKHDPKFKR